MFGWRDMREGIEGGGGEKFYLGVFFKWDEEGFEGIRRGKIPFQTPHFFSSQIQVILRGRGGEVS